MPDYAVISFGSKQYRVSAGERLVIDRLAVEEGQTFSPNVVATGDANGITDGGTVTARVEEHILGKKVVVFTYRAKKDSKKKRGHRSRQTRIHIESITA